MMNTFHRTIPFVLALLTNGVMTLTGYSFEETQNHKAPLPVAEPYLDQDKVVPAKPTLDTVTIHNYHGGKENSTFGIYRAGNKELRVMTLKKRPGDLGLYLFINNKEVGMLKFWGSNEYGSGYPYEGVPGKPAKLEFDEKTGTSKFSKIYLSSEGEEKEFVATLTPLEDGRIEIGYRNAAPWLLLVDEYRQTDVSFDDVTVSVKSRSDLVEESEIALDEEFSGKFVYDSDHPGMGYSIDFGSLSGSISERIKVKPKNLQETYYLAYHTSPSNAESRIYIDLGMVSAEAEDTPPPVGGIDFWKLDAMHVPLSPTRNVMPNPSFEQGLRYWSWATYRGASFTPEDINQTEVVDGGLFGQKALLYRKPKGTANSTSFPMALDKGEVYTFSFYAKAKKAGTFQIFPINAAIGGTLQNWYPDDAAYSISEEWQRFSKTFTADDKGIFIVIRGGSAEDVLLDGLQLEKGESPTEFVCDPVEGKLESSNPDNDIVKGAPIEARMRLSGKPGTRGQVVITAENAFRETVHKGTYPIEIGADGVQIVSLPLDAERLGEGIFVVRAEYQIGELAPYYDYYRLSIMTPLENTHATKNLFSATAAVPDFFRIGRAEDGARKYREWGFGSIVKKIPIKTDTTDEMERAELEILQKNRIQNLFTGIYKLKKQYGMGANYKEWKEIPPEVEQQIEEDAYNMVKDVPLDTFQYFGFGNEEEGGYLISNKQFDEYAKAQHATYRGVKRANPDALVAPTSGTSGYNILRGYDEIEGYLTAAEKAGFRYDAIAVHPYSNGDKGWLTDNDRDAETARLIQQMKSHGYGKDVPILYNEGGNLSHLNVPQWSTHNNDRYHSGKLSYDFSNKEMIQAATYARQYIMDLKYWPQLQQSNIWTSPVYFDQYLTPLLLCKAVNTLGSHMGYVEFQQDIKPHAGIRGYAFKLKDGSGLAPIWCVDAAVEQGYKKGPEIRVKFTQDVSFIDMMGNEREAEPDSDGYTTIPLTPAPLLIKANDVEALANSLLQCQLADARSMISTVIVPQTDGSHAISVENLTSLPQAGTIEIDDREIRYELTGNQKESYRVDDSSQGNQLGRLYEYETEYSIVPQEGEVFVKDWEMDYFYVPYTSTAPDWENIPAITLPSRYNPSRHKKVMDPETGKKRNMKVRTADNGAQDLSGSYQMAWDDENLYLRVEVTDDRFVRYPEVWEKATATRALYQHDGSLEVYFDCGANGRINLNNNYDDDDYRFDFSVNPDYQDGAGLVYRLHQVDHQLAGGVDMPSREEASENIECEFEFTPEGYRYTLTFPQRYIEPLWLQEGVIAGFCLFVHDRDNPGDRLESKGLTLSTENGEHPQGQAKWWPLMILRK